jgi:hypothetical protein
MNMHSKPPRHLKGFYSRKIKTIYERHRNLINRGLIGAGMVLCVIIIAGFIPYSNTALREKVERACVKTFADKCSIKRIAFIPWLGFTIDGLELSKRENGTSWQVAVQRVRLSYSFIPLLFRYVVIKRFTLEKPRFHMDLRPASVPVSKKESGRFSMEDLRRALSGFPFTVAVRAVSVDKGNFTVDQHDKPLIAGTDLDVFMKVGFDKTLLLDGKIAGRQIRLSGLWDINDLRARVNANDFTVNLSDCRGDFYAGKMSASGSADLSQGILNGFRFELSHVNMNKLYQAARIGQGECSGRLDGNLVLESSMLAPDSLKGKGSVALSSLTVRNLPIQNSLVVFIAIPKLRNIYFTRLGTDLVVRQGRIFTPNIKGDGDPLEIQSEGWVAFDGHLSEKFDGVFSRDVAEGLPPIVVRSLDEAENGKKSFKAAVSGTFKNPQLQVDRRIVNRAVGNVVDEVVKGLGNLFKK